MAQIWKASRIGGRICPLAAARHRRMTRLDIPGITMTEVIIHDGQIWWASDRAAGRQSNMPAFGNSLSDNENLGCIGVY